MVISTLRQLWELLHKAADIVPGDKIVTPASSHHNAFPVGNPTGSISTVTQLKGFSSWHSLCSEIICTAPAAKQDNGVVERGRRPRCVIMPRCAHGVEGGP